MEKSDGKMKNPSLHRMKKELDEGRDGFWIMAGGMVARSFSRAAKLPFLVMAFDADTVADLIFSTLVCKPDNNELAKNYMNIVGQPFAEAKRTLGINHLNDLAKMFPDKFCIRSGSLSAIKGDEIGGVVDHMDRTVSKSKSRGSRGGGRGGRAGGTSGRGGYQGSYGAAFSTAPRGGARGIGYRGGSIRGGNSFSSDFGASSRGGFGSGGLSSSSRGGNDSFGGGGFNDSRRRDPSPPMREYTASGRGGETSYNSRCDNRGFFSNYDNFAETSRRRGSDDYDDRSYNNRRDDRYNDRYNDRGGRDRDYDDDYDNDRGRRHDGEPLKTTRTVTNEFYDDSRRGGGSSSLRGGDRDRDGYSNRDDGYRTQQQHSRWYSDEEDDWSRRRYDRDERGGRGREEYGRDRDYDDRHSSYDDRFRGGYEVEERGRDTGGERRGFPSTLQPPSDRPLFAPKPMSDEEEEARGGSYRRSGDTPPDPVRAREPCGPTDVHMPVPPGFEHLLMHQHNAPPGLGYPVSPPPGLDPVANPPRDPTRDPMKKTPSQRDHELEPEHVPIDELEQLVFSALQRQGGRDVEYDKIIGLILKHCRRDMSEVVLNEALQQHGGASPAMEKVCSRSERLEFETNDDGVDVVRLTKPFRAEAWEKYGRKDAHGPDYVSDDDETESAVSYQSARSSRAERQSVRSSQFERQSVRSATKPAPVTHSEAPAEIKQADEIWNFIRTNNYARYCSEVGGYEMSMDDVENYKPKMNKTHHYLFLSRPAYRHFFQFQFYDDKAYVYAMGECGPAAVMLDKKERAGGSERMRDERDVRAGSTVSSGHGRGGQRVDGDDAPVPRPSAYAFYFREDDPEDGREKLAPGRFKAREQVMLTTFNDFFEFYVMSLRDYEKAQQMGLDLYDDHKDMRHCDIAEWEKGFAGCHIPEGQARGYRATVAAVDLDKQQLKLFYVDFGTTVFANYLDVVPLRDSYKKYALCYRCSMEYFTEIDADDLWSARKSAKQLKNLEVTIEPLERRWEEKVLIVELTFVPPGDFSTAPRTYPTDLYRKRLAEPPLNTFSDIYR
ncbi:hypothetical protein PRIPAC_84319 [Pristionchus pacificus]|uniref:Tudor domain-containing protein n=1 Tax=Pristionchus pacificus TaxID=54126 RepID=A0A2A6BUW9_PRIPA|nr:hypothetical protein PRIPAC_84319 [Pristionchus pacificus]|eukprot:PDM69714.1 hypothetical protein PRIPAC_44810 [Pristionchus pacificus]